MENVFIKLLNMSISAGWLVIAVMVLRLLLKKAPKWISVTMWALVGIRLAVPFSFKSIFSLIPSSETVPEEILYSPNPEIHSGIPVFNGVINPVISESLAPDLANSVNPMQVILIIGSYIWLTGICAMLIYASVSYFSIKHKVREAIILEGNIWQSDKIQTPFILGIIKPKIYLPFAVADEDKALVIAHEKAHLKRKDHLIKPLAFLLLSVYWFNPLLWAAYILLCRDIELACDEKVVRDMGYEIKSSYSNALINCSATQKRVSACPLAFGEVGVKSRIKAVLRYKKPALFIILISVVICTVLALCFLTDPVASVNKQLDEFIASALSEEYGSRTDENMVSCIDHEIIGAKNHGRFKTVYMWVLYQEYSFDGVSPQEEGASHILTAITVKKEPEGYKLIELWTPRDGSFYADDIKSKVPFYLYGKALDSQRYIKKQQEKCFETAKEHFSPTPAIIGGADTPTEITVTKQLTLKKLISLSKKGESLSWSDLKDFSHYDTGSGLYIEVFPIDDMFSLHVGGHYDLSSEELIPFYMYLYANDGSEAVIDVRYNDVEEFIETHKDNPVVTHLSSSWSLCPVGSGEFGYGYFTQYYGVPGDIPYNHILYYPTATITSTKELELFEERMSEKLDLDRSLPDKDNFVTLAFNNIKHEYNDAFFEESTLFIVYISTGEADRYTVDSISKCQGQLTIGVKETLYKSTNTAADGWILCVSVNNSQLTDVESIRAIQTKTEDADESLMELPTVSYVYTASEEIVKPCFMLYRDGSFQLNLSVLDSNMYIGAYHVINDRILLTCDDGKSVYVFSMEGNKMIFNKDASSHIRLTDIPNGAVFELALPYEPNITD